MTLHPRHTTTFVSTIALIAALASPAFPQDAMSSDAMAPDAMSSMSSDAMATPMAGDAMMSDGMMMDDMAMDDMAMANDTMGMGDQMMSMDGKAIMITIENVLTGQPFSPSFFEARSTDSTPLFTLGEKASDALTAVAEGGNIGMFSVGAAMNKESKLGDAALAIHTLPGQTRTFIIHVSQNHPLIDGVWMLGNTNDGFSGVSAVDAFSLTTPLTVEVLGYDAGSEINNEKKGFLGALGGGNDRDPENGVIAQHAGIRGDADAPKDWNWDVNAPVATRHLHAHQLTSSRWVGVRPGPPLTLNRKETSMNGIVKPMRRGGWSGRGLIEVALHGQRFETQVGPREFGSKQDAIDWLQQVAAERSLKLAAVLLGPDARDYDQ